MEYLPYGNLQALGELDDPPINAHGKHVVIIGGGDTGPTASAPRTARAPPR